MAIIVKAYILVDSDNPNEVEEAVNEALNSAVFTSGSAVEDFVFGVEKTGYPLPLSYQEGDFRSVIPDASLLETANPQSLPC